MYILPKASMSSQILRTSSGLPVICGRSLTRSSQGKQTPGRTRGWGRPVMPLSFWRSAPAEGRSQGGVEAGGCQVPAEYTRGWRVVSVMTRMFSMLVSSCMMAPASIM